jgi:hypothetical protein
MQRSKEKERNIVCPEINKYAIVFFITNTPLVPYLYPEIMNCVRIGILHAAILIAALATVSDTPPIS